MPLCMHLSNPECCQQGVQACSQFSHLLAGTGSFACSLARLLTIITYGHYIAVNLMGHTGLLLDRGRNALALFNNLPGSLKNGRQSRLYLARLPDRRRSTGMTALHGCHCLTDTCLQALNHLLNFFGRFTGTLCQRSEERRVGKE